MSTYTILWIAWNEGLYDCLWEQLYTQVYDLVWYKLHGTILAPLRGQLKVDLGILLYRQMLEEFDS